jgi:hypothetical protein
VNALLIALTLIFGLVVSKPLVKREFMIATENEFTQELQAHEIDVFGVRGMYVEGVGVVFSTDISLVYTAIANPFQQTFSPEQKQRVHEKKLKQVPILIEQMRQTVVRSAGSLDALPMKENVIVGATIGYQSWEDKSDLPSQIVVQAQKQKILEAKLNKTSTDSMISVQVQQ